MRNRLLASTPFRLTLVLGTAFFAALLLAGLIAYTLIERELAQRMEQAISDDFKVISQAYGDGDSLDLLDSVVSHARAATEHERVYLLIGSDGATVGGNVERGPVIAGWSDVPASALALVDTAGQYRVFVGPVGPDTLLVGQSYAESTEIARLTLSSIGWASVAVLVLVMTTGIVLALRGQRRIDGIAATMAQVGQGELGARIAVGPRGDDIDVLARQVNAALDRLSALVEGMRQVSVNIAHDLKTPLNRLAITIEDAGRAEGAGLAAVLAQADDEIQQINATFDALLRIAQIEAGARRARFVPLQLADVLGRIRDAYTDVAEERGQTLRVSWDGALPLIEGDADLLTQLCANLVENSMRHCPAGTQIAVTARRDGTAIVLSFADSGLGIPESERGKVFDRLYRLDKSRTTSGSGLGLSLVKAIAELHGATIALGDNAPGTRVEIMFS